MITQIHEVIKGGDGITLIVDGALGGLTIGHIAETRDRQSNAKDHMHNQSHKKTHSFRWFGYRVYVHGR